MRTALEDQYLGYNYIVDLGPLNTSSGLGTGDEVWVQGTPDQPGGQT